MPRIVGFCGGTYQSQSPNIDAEDCTNLYPEKSESAGAKTPIALLHTPGTELFCALPEVAVPAEFSINGRTFAACSKLYEVFADGSSTVRGSLGAVPVTPPQIFANQVQLLILNNGALFTLNLATNVFAAVNMAQFNGPVAQIEFADGYFLAMIANSNTFQQSNLEDGATWSGLNISTNSLFPDNYVSMKVDHRGPMFHSGKKAVGYYNAGAGFPVFIPQQGVFFETGCGAAFATVQMDNTIFWLNQDDRGSMIALRSEGNSYTRVSTHAVETAWQSYPVTSDAVAYSYQDQGHSFWMIRFPSANVTWCYDASTQMWHKRAFWNTNTGAFSAHHSTCHTFNFGKHLVGDWASGNIYHMSTQIYSDVGGPLRWRRRSPTQARDQKWGYFSEFQLDVEVGLGTLVDGAGQPRDPEVLLRWSNDSTKNWSNEYTLKCGQTGNYGVRAIKRMLGRGRNRVWEVSGSDPIPWRIADAYQEVS